MKYIIQDEYVERISLYINILCIIENIKRTNIIISYNKERYIILQHVRGVKQNYYTNLTFINSKIYDRYNHDDDDIGFFIPSYNKYDFDILKRPSKSLLNNNKRCCYNKHIKFSKTIIVFTNDDNDNDLLPNQIMLLKGDINNYEDSYEKYSYWRSILNYKNVNHKRMIEYCIKYGFDSSETNSWVDMVIKFEDYECILDEYYLKASTIARIEEQTRLYIQNEFSKIKSNIKFKELKYNIMFNIL